MRPEDWSIWRSASDHFSRLQLAGARTPDSAAPRRRRILPQIETGPLVAGVIVLGVPLFVWLALIFGSDGVQLGGVSFAFLVFGLFLAGFIYEVRRLSQLP
ncbi:hypothetical protein [Alsobacter soli]|uniref:hypothetical protein n=1 Tax=Alsobacter soli TaxID=2109933 RepID=UPI0011B27688|nr:hypothetical protein [Alsobacter soli]